MRILNQVFKAKIINHELEIEEIPMDEENYMTHESLPREIQEIENIQEQIKKAAEYIAQENEKNKAIKKRVNKEGSEFPIIIKMLVE